VGCEHSGRVHSDVLHEAAVSDRVHLRTADRRDQAVLRLPSGQQGKMGRQPHHQQGKRRSLGAGGPPVLGMVWNG